MLIKDVGRLSILLPKSALSNYYLWHRPAEQVKPVELHVFLRAMAQVGRRTEALRNIDSLLSETYKQLVEGTLSDAPYISFADEPPPFTVGDLCQIFENLSVPRRRAALFALEMQLAPDVVMALDHFELKKYILTPLAEAVVKGCPRHFRLSYVFWDKLSNGAAAPLFGLKDSIEEAAGMSWENLLVCYRRMVWVDPDMEKLALLNIFPV